jgi:SAM-dependent methyltransferase
MSTKKSPHGHAWVVGLAGIALGASLMVFFPKLEAVAGAVLLVVLFHLIGAAVVLGSLAAVVPRRFAALRRRLRPQPRSTPAYDFGWSWVAMNGLWVATLAIGTAALGLQLQWPSLWPAWLLLALLAVNCFIGGLWMRTSKDPAWATLPLVDLLRSPDARVLDAGCGAGRTTIALSRVLGRGRVIALDRFDADYIEGGGRTLLDRNLEIAGLADRVEVRRGDLTELPFPEAHFDAAVSAHAIDHLGRLQRTGLAEVRRVLRPGGRFLLVVWVPGWTMFTVGNVLSFLLTGKAGWRRMAAEVGLEIRDEGLFNGAWYLLLERPA